MADSDVYCTPSDIKLGELQLPRHVDVEQWIQDAANEMNSYIGQLYKLPLVLDPQRPDHLADILLLQKINADLTTGKIILLAFAGKSGEQLHAYGKMLVDSAKAEMTRISKGVTVLEAAERLETDDPQPNGPLISNMDDRSFVGDFYNSYGSRNQGYDAWGINYG